VQTPSKGLREEAESIIELLTILVQYTAVSTIFFLAMIWGTLIGGWMASLAL